MARILQVIADGAAGGGTTHVLALLRNLKDGFELSLVTQPRSYLSGQAAEAGIPTHPVEMFSSRLDRRAARALQAVLDQLQPDLVHLHGARAGWYFVLAGRPVRCLYTVHGYHFTGKPAALRLAALMVERIVSKRAQAVLFVSQHDREIARQERLVRPGKPLQVIYNGVRLPPASRPQAEPAGIGFIGRLVPPKDPGLFLEIARRLPEHPFILAGQGELEEALRQEIRQAGLANVRLTGGLSRQQVLELLPGLDMVVITSRWEGLPYLPLEAMALGTPVVAVAVGGIPEIIQDGVSGLLVRQRTPEALTEAVRRLAGDRELHQRLSAGARERVQALFSEEQMVSKIKGIYEQLLGST